MTIVNQRYYMEIAYDKWKIIASYVMRNGGAVHCRTGQNCQKKWGSLYGEYKKIIDYGKASGNNIENYWQMNSDKKGDLDLPK